MLLKCNMLQHHKQPLHITYICFFFNPISRLVYPGKKINKKTCFFQPTGGDSHCVVFPPKAGQVSVAGLCCCTFVGINQGLIFEAMPMLYMASSNENKQKIKRWVWEGMSNVKTYTLVLGKVMFVQTVSKAKTISYRRECVLFEKCVEHSNVKHQEPELCNNSAKKISSEPRSKQSFTSARARKSNTIPSHQPKLKYSPLDCA